MGPKFVASAMVQMVMPLSIRRARSWGGEALERVPVKRRQAEVSLERKEETSRRRADGWPLMRRAALILGVGC